jgi:hypothetical protein
MRRTEVHPHHWRKAEQAYRNFNRFWKRFRDVRVCFDRRAHYWAGEYIKQLKKAIER